MASWPRHRSCRARWPLHRRTTKPLVVERPDQGGNGRLRLGADGAEVVGGRARGELVRVGQGLGQDRDRFRPARDRPEGERGLDAIRVIGVVGQFSEPAEGSASTGVP